MEKQIKALLAFTIVIIAGFGIYTSQTGFEPSDIILENAEALAYNEADCHYSNGVKNIQLEPSFWHYDKIRYYDCCGVQIDGYDDDGPCS